MARAVTIAVGLAVLLFASSACGFGASRGTMSPPDANGEVDPSAAPDFIAYGGRTDRIIGWVPSRTYSSLNNAATGHGATRFRCTRTTS